MKQNTPPKKPVAKKKKTKSTKPILSVVMPTYQRLQLLKEAIASVRSNGFEDYELIVSDDGKDPQVRKLVESYRDPRYSYYEHERAVDENGVFKGNFFNMHFGASKAQGEFIFKMDDDDVIYPGFLEKTVSFLQSHPDVVIVFTGYDVSYHRKKHKSVIDNNFFLNRNIVDGEEYIETIFLNKVIPKNQKSYGVYRREVAQKIDFYNKIPIDFMFVVGMTSLGKIGYIPEALFEYRLFKNHGAAAHYRDLDYVFSGWDNFFKLPWVQSNPRLLKFKKSAKNTFLMQVVWFYIYANSSKEGLATAFKIKKQLNLNHPQTRTFLFLIGFWVIIFSVKFKINLIKINNQKNWLRSLANRILS